MLHARATLSDSGTISEEASILGLRAVNLREACERPEAMEEGTVMLTGLDAARVIEALRIEADGPRTAWPAHPTVRDYEAGLVSEKVVRVLLSYTHAVKRTLGRKPAVHETSA
jgi:UDP-N-acetylglucosamine 2-epimerase (non-hydrolysing)